jgi:hypothetical protein
MSDRLKTVWVAMAAPGRPPLRRPFGIRVWAAVKDGYSEVGTGHVFQGGEVVIVGSTDERSQGVGVIADSIGLAREVDVYVGGGGGDNPWPPPPPPPPPPEARLQVYGKNPWPPPPPPPPPRADIVAFAAAIEDWFGQAPQNAANHVE